MGSIATVSMTELDRFTFESTQTLTQREFAVWARKKTRHDDHRYELLNGRVVMEPPAGWPHGEAETLVAVALAEFVRARDLGKVLGSSQGFELPSEDTVAPDVAFVSWERWRVGPAPRPGRFLQVVPDLVVEVLSPGTGMRDRGEKKAIYERNGVREYWLLDPRARLVRRFVAHEGRFDGGTDFGPEEVLVSVVLEGFAVAVASLAPSL
jgi:Uma2 family endonuclease